MKELDLTQAPYYARVSEDGTTKVLYKPGDYVQCKELNELQIIYRNSLKGVADCVLKDGDIRSGLQIIIEGKTVRVTDGKVYLEGMIHDFKEQSLEITGKGTEVIGLVLDKEIITYQQNSDLLCPAAGFPAFSIPGADRLKETPRLTLNDENATKIYVIEDGVLVNEVKHDDGTVIQRFMTTLARRTYDESGHYKVWGMELSQKKQYDEENLYLSLSEGKAYVEGWEIEKQTATTIPIERSTSTRSIASEPKVYNSSHTKYALNNNPVARIDRLTSVISVSTMLTRQGSVNGSDPIPSQYTPTVEIQSITQVGQDITYEKNVDFVLEADTVRWLEGGKQPDLGSSYNITFTYNKKMIQGEDYKLSVDNNIYYVELLEEGDKPVQNSQMLVDYHFYLYYIASITLDKNGFVRVIPGQPDVIDKITNPDIADQSVLLLGHARVSPMDDVLYIVNSKTVRSNMDRIQRMFEWIEDMEINQAITDLDKEAIEGEDATQLKGIFTDGFLGFTKADINHKEYDASINPIEQTLTTGFVQNVHELTVDKEKSTSNNIYNRIATGKSEEVLLDRQPYATQTHLINPYTVFPEIPSITITPAVDKWIDTENITIQRDGGTVVRNEYIDTDVGRTSSGVRRGGTWITQGSSQSSSKSQSRSTNIINTAIEYMRPIRIQVIGKKFLPHQDNIKILFNDIEMDATPNSDTYKGLSGNLRADEKGVVRASFLVPSNTRCGTVNVKIFTEDYPTLIGSTPFTANGTLKKTINTVTTTTHVVNTIYRERVYPRVVDPIAQTFMFEKDQLLTTLGVYFAVKDKKHDVTIQIRETDNGYPTNIILAEKVITHEDIEISKDSSKETKIVFDDPVYCKADTQYAFTVLTNSSFASMFVEELGKKDLLTKAMVVKNPYIPGVMFSSSNALAWTAHQTKNIKFNMYCNTFEPESVIYFNALNGIDYDRIALLADTSVPIDCSLTWEYSSDGGVNWLPLAINTDTDLSKPIDNITIRAIFKAKENISPAVDLDSLLFTGAKNKEESSYITRNIELDKEYTSVKIIADVFAPSGTGVVFYYATDINGEDWKTVEQSGEPNVKQVGGYIEYTYTATETNAKNFRAKVALTTNDTTVRPKVKNLKCILK